MSFFLAFLSAPTLAQTAARYRPDLAAILAQHFCNQKVDTSHPSKLWRYEFYDFDLLTYHIQAQTEQRLSSRQVQKAAFHLAARNRHAGYAFAVCSERAAWIATTPSPNKTLNRTTEALQISLDSMKQRCRSLTIDHASNHSSKIRRILQHQLQGDNSTSLQINHHLLSSGFLSLTCLPKQQELGPLTWAMFPIQYQFSERADPPQTLPEILSWINQQRQQDGLLPVEASQTLLHQAAASLSRHNQSVHHFRPQLKKIRDHLQSQQIRLIGENRVRAGEPALLSWLLWNSPRHRSLLLNRKATHIGMHLQQLGDEQLLVILLAELKHADKPAPLARSSQSSEQRW
ncbi:MAG: CAP domain-containing protein [Oligoflexus sp.]